MWLGFSLIDVNSFRFVCKQKPLEFAKDYFSKFERLTDQKKAYLIISAQAQFFVYTAKLVAVPPPFAFVVNRTKPRKV